MTPVWGQTRFHTHVSRDKLAPTKKSGSDDILKMLKFAFLKDRQFPAFLRGQARFGKHWCVEEIFLINVVEKLSKSERK